MFNARKINPLPSAFADGKVSCVGGRPLLPAIVEMAHMTVSFPIYRGVTR